MSIGIVGSGVAGLHLGLYLQQHDVPVTIYTDKTGAELAAGRFPNTVGHHHSTLERERELGVHFWDADEYGYVCHHHYVGGEQPLFFRGDFEHPSSVIDYRLYLPRLMEEYENRGGELVVGALQAEDVERLSQKHDLMVVASGRGSLTGMFERVPAKSMFDKPQRRLSAGLYHGVAETEPKGVSLSISPGQGELIELPTFSREGFVTALLFENIPGGDLEILADAKYDDDPAAFNRLVLEKLEVHHPKTFERVDHDRFGLMGPLDIIQGALTPTVRADYVQLASGKYAMSVGDVHTVVDPMMGQGANAASYSAWTLGEAIVSDYAYDERFCQRVAARREDRVLSATYWTNLMLQPPAPHVMQLIGAMSQNKVACDIFTSNFADPSLNWDIMATPERTEAFLAQVAPVAA